MCSHRPTHANSSHVWFSIPLLLRTCSKSHILPLLHQILQLESNSEWTIDSVVTNGAVFGSQTSLESGAMQLSGKEYMPHSLKILTPQAEITTLSENFRLAIAPSGELRIDALDGVAVTVKNDQGALVTSENRPSVHVVQGSAPVDPDSFKD